MNLAASWGDCLPLGVHRQALGVLTPVLMESALGGLRSPFPGRAFLFPRCLPTSSLALGAISSLPACQVPSGCWCSGRLQEAVILNGSKRSQLLPIIYLLDRVTKTHVGENPRLLCSRGSGLSSSELSQRWFLRCELRVKSLSVCSRPAPSRALCKAASSVDKPPSGNLFHFGPLWTSLWVVLTLEVGSRYVPAR